MNQILNNKNKNYAKKCFRDIIDIGIDFKLKNKINEKHFDKRDIEKMLILPQKESTPKEIISEFKRDILPFCTNFSNSKFMGFPDAGNSISGIAGALASDFLQQNLINSSFCAPIATFIEIAVIKWLREIIGYEIKNINNIWDVGGIITYGGTGSNATAMLLARENFKANTMKNGIRNPKNYKVLIPKCIGHYSIKSSLMWLGCGDNVIEVDTEDFKYDLNALENALKKYNKSIMCVVVYAGDSRTMTIENLRDVYELVKNINDKIWLHVDACHGFSLAFSEKLKYKIDGINLYDSISIDPHKVLAVPYCVSALLIKEPSKMRLISSTSDLIMQGDYDFGQITPFIGSKSWISLKLWFAIKSTGIDGYAKMIERRCKNANYLKNLILQSKEFLLINDVDINSVVFMYVKDKNNHFNIKYLNDLSLKIYNRLMEDGSYYLHKFTIMDNKGIIKKNEMIIPLRYMSGNDNLTKKDLINMLNQIKQTAGEIENE